MNPKDISIDADLEELSAVVTYVVETTFLDASGAAIYSEKVKNGEENQVLLAWGAYRNVLFLGREGYSPSSNRLVSSMVLLALGFTSLPVLSITLCPYPRSLVPSRST